MILKGGHYVTVLNVTTPEGHIILFANANASSSPAYGDSMVTATMISEDIIDSQNGSLMRTGLTTLAKG